MFIIKVIFSSNRLEYLVRTLEHQKNLDFGKHKTKGIIIDDYPLNRDDDKLKFLAKRYGYDELILHKENIGITGTWSELFDYLKNKNFDYIWHQEDDTEITQPLKVDTMIRLLEKDKSLCQVQLKRQAWYDFEKPILLEDSDIDFEDYKYNKRSDYFWSMASLYHSWITKLPVKQQTGYNCAEGTLMWYLRENFNLSSGVLKDKLGNNLVNHIGEYYQGIRTSSPNDPGYDNFSKFDPTVKYCSKTGRWIESNIK
jgi:hypothetical protein